MHSNSMPMTQQEAALIRDAYINQDLSASKIAELVNRRFYKNVRGRSTNAIEHFLKRNGIRKKMARAARHVQDKTAANRVEKRAQAFRAPSLAVQPESLLLNNVTRNDLLKRISVLEKQLSSTRDVRSMVDEAIRTSVACLKPVAPTIIRVKPGMHKAETAMLELGDIHVGEKYLLEESSNLAEYDFKLFLKRMDRLWEGLHECVSIQRARIPIPTLDINMLGDIVTSEDIYLGQLRNIDMPLIDQTMAAAHVIGQKLIMPAAKFFKKVRIRAVTGNHGKIGRDGQYHPRTNFDYIVYVFLKEQFKNFPNVEFYISTGPLLLYRLPEAKNFLHLLTHGNETRGWNGIPFYGLQRDQAKYVQLTGQHITHIHIGHFHNAATLDIPSGEQIINGSFSTGSDLALYKLKTKSQPKQLLFGFNNTHGITWRYDIKLDKMPELKADKNGLLTPVHSGNGYRHPYTREPQ